MPSGRASIMVTSETPVKKIMCERAMYWNNKGGVRTPSGGMEIRNSELFRIPSSPPDERSEWPMSYGIRTCQ